MCLFLDEKSEILLLSISSLLKDLSSSVFVDVWLALSTLAFIATPEMIQALTPQIIKLLDHEK